mmetsp:Transcript_12640/g.19669  ORF Transcript_12640/g.19669 Transcript_12640/m.19669 type:complete len:149 (+) Transcript_12640:1147-1593(+)
MAYQSEVTLSQHSVKPCKSLAQSLEQVSSERNMDEIVVDNQQEIVNIKEGVTSSSSITSSLDTPPLKALELNSSLSGLELQGNSSSLSSRLTPKRKDLPTFEDNNFMEHRPGKQFAFDPLKMLNSQEPELEFKPHREQVALRSLPPSK